MVNRYYTMNKLGAEGQRIEVRPLVPVRVKLPYSEVMMHLGWADQYRDVILIPVGDSSQYRHEARILKEGWRDITETDTLEVTTGEAGILTDRSHD